MENIKILVPTDFSHCANNALNYALGLASEIQAEIILMHSIIYNDSTFISDHSREEENQKRFNEAKVNLDQAMVYANNKNPQIKIKTLLDAGPTELSISMLLDSEKIDFVVMGTEGATGLQAEIFGSFTSNVLLIAHCPVFTIPGNAQYKSIRSIVCATEMNETEINAIKHSIGIAKKFSAGITFINVSSHKKDQDIAYDKFEKQISKISPYPYIDYILIESDNIVDSIDNYVCDIAPDLLITLGKEKTFFDKLFGKHVTKKLCLHTSIPLLSFPAHYAEEKEMETFKRSYK